MILGLERPALVPTMDIYNTDLMKMYITAVKDLYDTARKDYLDFLKQYQDFYSSLPGANEYWYNNTIGKAQQLFEQAAANGVDLFKTKEGQGAIQNLIRSVPAAQLAQVKKYSENYDTYLKNKADLDRQGKYSDPREQYELLRQNLSDYTLLGENGDIRPWERLSPIQNRSMSEIIDPIYKKFAPQERLRKGDQPFTVIKGVKPQNQQAALGASVLAMKASGDYDFYKQLAMDRIQAAAEQLGILLSPQLLEQAADIQVQLDIENAAAEYLQEKEEVDNIALEQWKVAQSAHQLALNRANSRYIAGLKNQQPADTGPNGFIDTLRLRTLEKINDITKSDPNDLMSALNEFKNYYKSLGYTDNSAQLKRINAIFNSKDDKELLKNSRLFLEKGGFADFDSQGNLVGLNDRYWYTFNKAIKRNHHLTYNDMVQSPVTDMLRTLLLQTFATKTSDAAHKGQYVTNSFQGDKYLTLTNRLQKVDRKPLNEIASKFEKYVNEHGNAIGYLNGPDDILSYGTIDSNRLDVNSNRRFKLSELEDFFDDTITKEKLALATGGYFETKIGLVVYPEKGKPNKKVPSDVEYIIIPSSGIVDVSGQNQGLIDSSYDKLFGGQANAFKMLGTRQNNSK